MYLRFVHARHSFVEDYQEGHDLLTTIWFNGLRTTTIWKTMNSISARAEKISKTFL